MGSGLRVLGADPVAIRTALHALHPLVVGQVPLDRLAQAGLERFLRPPAEFGGELAGVDRVAAVVARAILDERDQRRMGLVRRVGS